MKPYLTIGTLAPHCQHGQTTLAAALSDTLFRAGGPPIVSYDRLMSGTHSYRGVTISMRYLSYETDARVYGHLDTPSHLDYLKNCITAMSCMDAAIVVISAPDWDTKAERDLLLRLMMARHFGVTQAVVFLNQCDLLPDDGLLDIAEQTTREVLQQSGFDANATPVIRGAALLYGDSHWRFFIKELEDRLDHHLINPVRDINGPLRINLFRRALTRINSWSLLLSGRVDSGVVRVGDRVEILGSSRESPRGPLRVQATVASMEMFHRATQEGRAGELIALSLPSGATGWGNIPGQYFNLSRGLVVIRPGETSLSLSCTASVQFIPTELGGWHLPICSGRRCEMFFRSSNEEARIDLGSVQEVLPGETATVSLTLDQASLLTPGLRFVLRSNGRLMGLGVVLQAGDPVEVALTRWP
jgi:elongation factor Tu